ncbi:MAG: autotransporter domain-containing protein [Methyloprofundus sp.]|nr:autotransporter domain-containing protein [Methyloprofundus sp.]
MNLNLKQLVVLLAFYVPIIQAQDILTTDPSNCQSKDNIKVSIPKGTSIDVIKSSIASWQAQGFTVNDVQPNQDIITCHNDTDQNEINTPEEEALDQAVSTGNVTLQAVNLQTNNLYDRLKTLRKYTHKVKPGSEVYTEGEEGYKDNDDDDENEAEEETSGGGASADSFSILDERLNLFMSGNGSFGEQDRTHYSNGFDFTTIGTTLGADYRITDDFTLGTAFGYTASTTDMNQSSAETDIDSYSLSMYASYSLPNSFYLEGIVRTAWNHYDGHGYISSEDNPTVAEQSTSKYKGNDYSVSFSTGYDYMIKGFSISPFFRYDYIHVDIGSYQEKAGSTRNTIEAQNIDSMRTALGTSLSYVFNTDYAVLIPSIRAEWQHEYMNDSRLLGSYQDYLANDSSEIRTDSPDRDFANLGVGLSAVFPHGISAFFFYETMLANHLTTVHSFNGGIQIQF